MSKKSKKNRNCTYEELEAMKLEALASMKKIRKSEDAEMLKKKGIKSPDRSKMIRLSSKDSSLELFLRSDIRKSDISKKAEKVFGKKLNYTITYPHE